MGKTVGSLGSPPGACDSTATPPSNWMGLQEHYSNPKHRSRGCHPANWGFTGLPAACSLVVFTFHRLSLLLPTVNTIFYTTYSDRTHCTQFSTCSQSGNPEKWPDRDGLFSANHNQLIPSLVSVSYALVLMGKSD